MSVPLPEHLQELIAEKLADNGYELYEVKYFQAGPRAVLRVMIDSEKGVTIADCERASKELSVMLDVEEFSTSRAYSLEISTPGIDRRLTTERDFKRTVGRFVNVQMKPEYPGSRTVRGKVTGTAEGTVSIVSGDAVVTLPLSQVIYGKEEIQFK